MIVILTRNTGVRVAVNILQVLTVNPNALNTQCTIDMSAGPSIVVNEPLEQILDTLTRAIPRWP